MLYQLQLIIIFCQKKKYNILIKKIMNYFV